MKPRGDMVLLSGGMWDERWTTYQRIAGGMRREFRVLYVEGNYSWGKFVKAALGAPFPCTLFGRLRRQDADFWILTPPPRLPLRHVFAPIGRLNQRILAFVVRRAMRRLGMHRPILWTFLHQTSDVVGRLGERCSVYHCVDYWPWLMPRVRWMGRRRRIELDEAKTARAVAFTVATSRFLWSRMLRLNPASAYVPNAADAELFGAAATPLPCPRDLVDLPRPILGFSGTLEAKTDIELLCRLAAERPDWTFAFVGHADNVPQIGRLRRLQNVHFLGLKQRDELPGYFRAFDICLVPFHRAAEIDSISPLKVFEYLAAGRPVVATDVAELQDLGDFVHLVAPGEDFATHIEDALAGECDALVARRLAFARTNGWDTRVRQLLELLDAHESGGDGVVAPPNKSATVGVPWATI